MILVLGRNGQLARELARGGDAGSLAFAGRDEIDLGQPETVRAAIVARAPQAIINAAAYTAVDKAEDEIDAARNINARSVREVALAARELDIPFVHVSTDYVFDGEREGAYAEDDEISPLGAYGLTKAEGEAAIAETGGRTTILRTAWVFSPFGSNFVKTMLRVAETRDEVGVVRDQAGRPTHAGDIAAACVDLVRMWREDERAPGIVHFAGADDAVWADVAEEVFRVSGENGGPVADVKRITTAEYPLPARRPANSRLSTALAETIGLKPAPWRPRVRACVEEILKS